MDQAYTKATLIWLSISTQERLNNLVMIYIHKDREIDFIAATLKDTRLNLFLINFLSLSFIMISYGVIIIV